MAVPLPNGGTADTSNLNSEHRGVLHDLIAAISSHPNISAKVHQAQVLLEKQLYQELIDANGGTVIATGRFDQFGISRTPLHQISNVRVTNIYRISHASVAYHWAESFVLQFQLRPSWLRKFREKSITYEKRRHVCL